MPAAAGPVSIDQLKGRFKSFKQVGMAAVATAGGAIGISDSPASSQASSSAGSVQQSPKSGAAGLFERGMKAMGLEVEADERVTVKMEPRGGRLTMKKPDGTAGDSWDEDTTMSVPPGNTHTMDECKRMYRWLENLEHNLQILDRRYRDYCDAAENASLRATELAECAECFASSRCAATPDPFAPDLVSDRPTDERRARVCSDAAKQYKELLERSVEAQESVFSESRDKLEDIIGQFWQREDSLPLYEGTLNKMLGSSSTSYCVAVARALATANKETYTREFDKSRKELGFYAAKRWDYVVACENVGARCELDLDDLFLSMLEAQTGVTQTQQKQYTEMSSAVETATELSKVRLMLLSRRAKSNAA